MRSYLNDVIQGTLMLKAHPKVLRHQMVGSACYMPDPKDIDFLVLVDWSQPANDPSEMIPTISSFLAEARWFFGNDYQLCAGEYDDRDERWLALRSGNINLIVTHDAAWYDRAKLANEVCHGIKLADKTDRVRVYRIIRDAMTAEQAHQVRI